jgi:hypothetical protein
MLRQFVTALHLAWLYVASGLRHGSGGGNGSSTTRTKAFLSGHGAAVDVEAMQHLM